MSDYKDKREVTASYAASRNVDTATDDVVIPIDVSLPFIHTAGPWRVHDESNSHPWEIYPAGGGTLIARISKLANEREIEESWANARLIAAAPDLLSACVLALRAIEDDHYYEQDIALRAAIARAATPD